MKSCSGTRTSPATVRSDLLDRGFRASSAYEVVPFDDLPSHLSSGLEQLRARNPGLEAVLLPGRPGLSVKVIERAAIELVSGLRSGGRLPNSFADATKGGGSREIARLVLDGVLEVETEAGYLSGAPAVEIVLTDLPEPTRDSRTSALSLDALRYAQELRVKDPATVADRLYRFNRLPASPRWRRMFPTERSIADRLGLDGEFGSFELSSVGGPLRTNRLDPTWLHWLSGTRRAGPAGASYKLYVSPRLDGLRQAFNAVVGLFRDSEPPRGFKIGRALPGLLRPDKLVVYFDDEDRLDEAASRLQGELAGIPPQAVPFTVDYTGDGLLSWGVDPPREWQLPGWRYGDSSWRSWLTTRLAAAIVSALHEEANGLPPWRFALARVAVEDVDPDSWMPDPAVWESQAAS